MAEQTLTQPAASPEGPLTIETLARQAQALKGARRIDLARVTALDTAGAWAIVRARTEVEAQGGHVEIVNLTDSQRQLIDTVAAAFPAPEPKRREIPGRPGDGLEQLGRDVADTVATAVDAVAFLGEVMAHLAALLLRPWRRVLIGVLHPGRFEHR